MAVLDNVGYHKSRKLRELWRQATDHFQPFWLPASSPQLNLSERLWHYQKDKLRCHRWWTDLDCLIQATETMLGRIIARFHIIANR